MFSIIIHVYDIRRRFIRRGGTYKPWRHGAPWRSHGEPFRTVTSTPYLMGEKEKKQDSVTIKAYLISNVIFLLQNFPCQEVERHNKPEVEMKYVAFNYLSF